MYRCQAAHLTGRTSAEVLGLRNVRCVPLRVRGARLRPRKKRGGSGDCRNLRRFSYADLPMAIAKVVIPFPQPSVPIPRRNCFHIATEVPNTDNDIGVWETACNFLYMFLGAEAPTAEGPILESRRKPLRLPDSAFQSSDLRECMTLLGLHARVNEQSLLPRFRARDLLLARKLRSPTPQARRGRRDRVQHTCRISCRPGLPASW